MSCRVRTEGSKPDGSSPTGQTDTPQRTEGGGHEGTHTHPATVHEHDHYYVSHHHMEGVVNEWEHRTYWHSHKHNHAELTHAHDYNLEEEVANHAKETHVHDHMAPIHSHS